MVVAFVCLSLSGYGGVVGYGGAYFGILSSGTFLGYVVILIGLLIGCFLDDWMAPRPLYLYFLIFGGVLFLFSGALGLVGNGTIGLIAGGLSIAEGVLLLVDAFLVYKNKM